MLHFLLIYWIFSLIRSCCYFFIAHFALYLAGRRPRAVFIVAKCTCLRQVLYFSARCFIIIVAAVCVSFVVLSGTYQKSNSNDGESKKCRFSLKNHFLALGVSANKPAEIKKIEHKTDSTRNTRRTTQKKSQILLWDTRLQSCYVNTRINCGTFI